MADINEMDWKAFSDKFDAMSDQITALQNELKDDNQKLRNELKGDIQALKDDNQKLRNELKDDMESFQSEVNFSMSAMQHGSRGDFARATVGKTRSSGPFAAFGGVQDDFYSHLDR